MGKLYLQNQKIVIPYQRSLLEIHLEEKLAQAGFPLLEAKFDNDENFRLIRDSLKNKNKERISYWADYNYLENYTDVEKNIIINEKLLKRLSKDPDSISFFCGDYSTHIHNINKDDVSIGFDAEDNPNFKNHPNMQMQQSEFRMLEANLYHAFKNKNKDWNNWGVFRVFIDKLVSVFASGNYSFKRID